LLQHRPFVGRKGIAIGSVGHQRIGKIFAKARTLLWPQMRAARDQKGLGSFRTACYYCPFVGGGLIGSSLASVAGLVVKSLIVPF
jgi:hypothetical protein